MGEFTLVLLLEWKTSKFIRQTHIQSEEAFFLTFTLELFKIQQNKSFSFLIQLYVRFAVISLYANLFYKLNGKSFLFYSVFINLSCVSVTLSLWVKR